MSDVRTSSFSYSADDGQSIHVQTWLPSGEPSVVVQIAHGMAEHGARYGELARALVARGYGVYVNDHRGHGRSVPENETHGHMGEDGFARAAADVEGLGAHIRKLHPTAKHVLFGHSMGSFLVQKVITERDHGLAAVVLSASNGRPPPIAAAGRVLARLERLRLGPRGRSKLLDQLSFRDFNKKFRPNRTDFDWISRDTAEVDAYVEDPWCGFMVTTDSWISLLDEIGPLTSPERLARIPKDLPVYLFAGERDPVGDMGRGVRRLADAYREAGLRNVTLDLYPGGRHEMLHETNRAQVVEKLIAWLARTVRG